MLQEFEARSRRRLWQLIREDPRVAEARDLLGDLGAFLEPEGEVPARPDQGCGEVRHDLGPRDGAGGAEVEAVSKVPPERWRLGRVHLDRLDPVEAGRDQ